MFDDEGSTGRSDGGPAKPGSQSALRMRNQLRLTDQLLRGGPATQAELSRLTGLSTATVSNIVKSMQQAGLVTLTATTSSGRRAHSVRYIGDSSIAAGIDFGRSHLRVVLANRSYQVVAERQIPLPLGHDATAGIAAATQLLEELLAEKGIARSMLMGAGAGIPGPIDRRTGKVIQGAILPEWVGINLHERLKSALDLPVFIENDANLGALAQITWGAYAAVPNLVFVKIGTGIGAGLIVNGDLYSGSIGVTGEIGHLTINESGLICRCGNRGCLETIASTATMIQLLSRGRDHPVDAEDIVGHAKSGDSTTLRVLEDAGTAVGRALANISNLMSPDVIVIGGPLASLGELLLAPIRRGLLRHAVPVVGENTTLATSSLGPRSEALGAVSLVFQHGPSLHNM
ncbi:ROK family transcriptional regulator [Arthrobacter wenxiniae]|uniref:ROK family transcriptional regulator n=1 Tax=Arthrobacter wenxiniae TaxID=2713570 RepID=A0A7Y7IDV2_9MICC|nr:ROK family transcriptional regulator [Arthrobacter wenxiniae]NVM93679.1 ROK family transcriptional regulator [Arthrobacter wenxiniae]